MGLAPLAAPARAGRAHEMHFVEHPLRVLMEKTRTPSARLHAKMRSRACWKPVAISPNVIRRARRKPTRQFISSRSSPIRHSTAHPPCLGSVLLGTIGVRQKLPKAALPSRDRTGARPNEGSRARAPRHGLARCPCSPALGDAARDRPPPPIPSSSPPSTSPSLFLPAVLSIRRSSSSNGGKSSFPYPPSRMPRPRMIPLAQPSLLFPRVTLERLHQQPRPYLRRARLQTNQHRHPVVRRQPGAIVRTAHRSSSSA